MAYRKSGTIYNRRIDKTGFTNYDDVYGIINDNVDKISEFYEIEPAMVLEVLLDPHSPNFPTKDFEGDKIPDYSYLGTIRARFIYSQNTGDEISDYIKPNFEKTTYPRDIYKQYQQPTQPCHHTL